MNHAMDSAIPLPTKVGEQFTRLHAWHQRDITELASVRSDLSSGRSYLSLSERVTDAIESLSQKLFRELLDLIEDKLTLALQEVLEQPIKLKAEVQWRRNAATVDFWIERDGNREDILKGQGG